MLSEAKHLGMWPCCGQTKDLRFLDFARNDNGLKLL